MLLQLSAILISCKQVLQKHLSEYLTSVIFWHWHIISRAPYQSSDSLHASFRLTITFLMVWWKEKFFNAQLNNTKFADHISINFSFTMSVDPTIQQTGFDGFSILILLCNCFMYLKIYCFHVFGEQSIFVAFCSPWQHSNIKSSGATLFQTVQLVQQ